MAQNNVSELNTSAASNTDFGGIGILGTNLVSTADDAFRANSAIIAKWWSDIGAVNTVAGTANAITVTTPTLYAAFKAGMVVGFKNTAGPNTGAVTLNLDALGAKAIRLQGDTALVGGEMVANGIYLLRYDTSYNSAAGAWVLLNPQSSTVILGTGMATFLATPSSANLRATLTDESGTGAALFQSGDLGTPTAGVATNLSGTAASLTAGIATVANGLKSATTTVVVSAATAPSSGQVLTATSGTAADWETPSSGGQPIPSASPIPIGCLIYSVQSSGGSITNGSTVSGASFTSAGAQTGTWKNVGGSTVATGSPGYWVRIS